jgi:hypothetical protein
MIFRTILLIIFLFFTISFNEEKVQEIIASDFNGIIVLFGEKYGTSFYDTGTVLMLYNNCFILTKKNEPSSWYPVENFSVKKIIKIKRGEK